MATMSGHMASESTSTFTVIVRSAPEGGYWAEVLELPGCASQGETKAELFENIIEAIGACLEAGSSPEPIQDSEIWRMPVPV